VASGFVVLFFAASEGAEAVFQTTLGPAFGLAAAGLLTFALKPLERMAEGLATVAVPNAKPLVQMSGPERHHLYLEQARLAWTDGDFDAKERRILDNLRERLGLSADEARALEMVAQAKEGFKARRARPAASG
jgi:hypothetical protein